MFADLELRRPALIPQAFSVDDGVLWVAQANNATGNAWVTAYRHTAGDQWRAGGEMAVYDSHGWPLIASSPGDVKRVGVIVKTGADAFYWFGWKPDARVHTVDGTRRSKVPVPGGWDRVTSGGLDRFYRSGALLFSRRSPGWVQGEAVVDGVLWTLRGSPVYTGGELPYGIPNEVWFTNASGKVLRRLPVPDLIGSDPVTGEPIGGRKEHEGLWRHGGAMLIGTAVGRKPNYRYHVTELEWGSAA